MLKTSKKFPDLSFAVGTDGLRPVMSYAIVQDGKIIATNSNILAVVNLSIWLERPEDIEKLNNKILDIHLLKKLAKPWADVFFHENHIMFVDKNGFCEMNYYSGKVDDGWLKKYLPISDDYSDIGGKYPNWQAVTPVTDKGKIKISEDPNTEDINIDLNLLNNASKALTTKRLTIKSTGKTNRPYILTPIMISEYAHAEFSEYVMIMPVSLYS